MFTCIGLGVGNTGAVLRLLGEGEEEVLSKRLGDIKLHNRYLFTKYHMEAKPFFYSQMVGTPPPCFAVANDGMVVKILISNNSVSSDDNVNISGVRWRALFAT